MFVEEVLFSEFFEFCFDVAALVFGVAFGDVVFACVAGTDIVVVDEFFEDPFLGFC